MGRSSILVVGCGSIGLRHLANLAALGAGPLLAFDVRDDRRAAAATRFGVDTVKSLDEAWERGPEIVVIAAPTSLHVTLALEAARHRCHLFVEKPLGDRIDGLDELLAEVRRRQLITLVGCNLRFHPGLAHVKDLLDRHAIGRVVAARIEVGQYLPDWHPSEDYRQGYSARRALGGGVILDAIHEIDYARWLLGEVRHVSCFAGRLSGLEIDTEDTAAILLRFANGAIGEVHLDYVQRAYSRTCHLIGEEGTIRWDYASGVKVYAASTRQWQEFPTPASWQPNDMYLDEMRYFIERIDRGQPTFCDVSAAARVLQIALAAKASAETGAVVELDGETMEQP